MSGLDGGEPRLLFEVSAPVGVRLHQLQKLVDNGWLAEAIGIRSGLSPSAGTPTPAGTTAAPTSRIRIQGGWWYRGEWTAERVDGEVRVVHRVFNVAGKLRWAVPLANRGFVGYRQKLRAGVVELARQINAHLAGSDES